MNYEQHIFSGMPSTKGIALSQRRKKPMITF